MHGLFHVVSVATDSYMNSSCFREDIFIQWNVHTIQKTPIDTKLPIATADVNDACRPL